MDGTRLELNNDQQAAADGFFRFLFDTNQKELIISGPGGVGKTFLMGHLIDEIMPRYLETCRLMGIQSEYEEVMMTATTNKAAEVLGQATGRPTQTIHSFMNLKVQDDFSSGKSQLIKSNSWTVHQNKIIFVDEASMVDYPLLNMIKEGTHNCKIIYVGDHCQLAPIMEPISPIYRQDLPFYELLEPMRNSEQPALMNLCNQLRYSVETGEFLPIQIVPGVIDHFDNQGMADEIYTHFMEESNSKILAYTNQRVIEYNNYIRELRNLPETFCLGESLINNNAIRMPNGMIQVEDQVKIIHMNPQEEDIEIDRDVYLKVHRVNLEDGFGRVHYDVFLPTDRAHFTALIKFYQKQKNWQKYFHLKNTYPDLRPKDAATVHKAQGSTHPVVFIDLENLSTCHNPNQAARLLYVAATRAQTRIVLYGHLVSKYGGIIH